MLNNRHVIPLLGLFGVLVKAINEGAMLAEGFNPHAVQKASAHFGEAIAVENVL